jgi:hypothetical protein
MKFLSFPVVDLHRAQQLTADAVSQIINFGGSDADMQTKTLPEGTII